MAPPADAAGPWKGQIVDAETGDPLEGVVVLAFWTRYTASPGGWAGGDFVDAEEAVTGPNGRFTISAHSTFTLLPLLWKITTEWVMFKPGYGRWDFRDRTVPVHGDVTRRMADGARLWKEFENEGVVLHMPRLGTRAERLRGYEMTGGIPPPVPAERAPRLRAALEAEGRYLGVYR